MNFEYYMVVNVRLLIKRQYEHKMKVVEMRMLR